MPSPSASSSRGSCSALVAAGLAVLVAGWYTGQERTLGQVLRVAGRRALPLAVAWGLVHVVEAVFLVGLLVAALAPMTWFAVVSPVVACERGSARGGRCGARPRSPAVASGR